MCVCVEHLKKCKSSAFTGFFSRVMLQSFQPRTLPPCFPIWVFGSIASADAIISVSMWNIGVTTFSGTLGKKTFVSRIFSRC